MTNTLELPNIPEITNLITSTPWTADHGPLLAALNARYPHLPFHLIGDRGGFGWEPGVLDAAGNRVSPSLVEWVDDKLQECGGDAGEVWRRYKDAGLVKTEWSGSSLALTAAYGPDPDQFFQLEIFAGEEVTRSELFDPKPYVIPEDRHDLMSGPCLVFSDTERKVLTPSRYRFERLTNIRRFLRYLVECARADKLAELPAMENKVIRVMNIDMGAEGVEGQTLQEIPFLDMCPDWLDRLPRELRLFLDWKESTPGGAGLRICDHWWMQMSDWTDKAGKRFMRIIPQWNYADGGLELPEIKPDWEDSPYGVMAQLEDFDRRVGYQFGWYFYMLHGNRVVCSAGGVIARAIRTGVMRPLPEHDEKVLLRWADQQYGF